MHTQLPAALSCCAVISSTEGMDPLGFRSIDFAECLKSDGIMIHTTKICGDHRHHMGERYKQAVAMKDCDIVELNFDEFIVHLQSNCPAFLLFFFQRDATTLVGL